MIGGALPLGGLLLERAAATPVGGPAWRALRDACAGSASGRDRQEIIALDGEVVHERLPEPLGPLCVELARLDAPAARDRLQAVGFECASLYWGAWSAAYDGLHHVLWRSDTGAVGPDDGRVALPLYPVVRFHAQRGEPILHAAAVAGRARTVLLLGPSGTGKSTAARNAELAGAKALAEDAVIVCEAGVIPLPSAAAVRPGQKRIASEPLAQPIAGLCFLAHGPREELVPLPRANVLRRLVLSCLVEVPAAAWLPRELQARVFDVLRRLAGTLPCFALSLRPTPDYYPLVSRELGLDA